VPRRIKYFADERSRWGSQRKRARTKGRTTERRGIGVARPPVFGNFEWLCGRRFVRDTDEQEERAGRAGARMKMRPVADGARKVNDAAVHEPMVADAGIGDKCCEIRLVWPRALKRRVAVNDADDGEGGRRTYGAALRDRGFGKSGAEEGRASCRVAH